MTFQYDRLDSTKRVIVQQRTSEIKSLMRKTAQDIVEIGHKLIEVKNELPHGEFLNWLESEFGWTDRTAQRFMNVANSFKNDNLSDLNIGTSALYMLSEPSTPEPARQEAIERAEKGESVSYSDAKELKKRYDRPHDRPELEEKAAEINQFLDEKELPENVDPDTGEITESPKEYVDDMLCRFCTRWDVPVMEVQEISNELCRLASSKG